jgi:hypothetical protein
MSLETFLCSKKWTIAVDRGFKTFGGDTIYYTYTFTCSPLANNQVKGFLTIESTTSSGDTIRIRDGVTQLKTVNPFTIVYTDSKQTHAFLKCSKLHGQVVSNKMQYGLRRSPPIVFNCERGRREEKEETWQLTGSWSDTRAFFTPNRSWHDHFGYLSVLLGSHSIIHLTRQSLIFHILSVKSVPLCSCRSVDLTPAVDDDPDQDLEAQMVASEKKRPVEEQLFSVE